MSLTSVKEYFTPGATNEVLQLLEQYGSGALIVAGGSFVHGLDARDLLYGVEALIDIRNAGLDQVTADSAGLTLGSMVTFATLKQLDQVRGAVLDLQVLFDPVQSCNARIAFDSSSQRIRLSPIARA